MVSAKKMRNKLSNKENKENKEKGNIDDLLFSPRINDYSKSLKRDIIKDTDNFLKKKDLNLQNIKA